MLRSRSLLALADLVLAAAVGFLTWDALRRLREIWPNPDSLLWRAASVGALIVTAVLVAGMHRGVERGRTDPVAAHRALSTTIWSGLLAAALGVTIYSRWVLGAPASALDSFESATPVGSDGWVAVNGVARGARSGFLYDTRTGRSQRVGAEPVVSADGSTAAWAERESRTAPWTVRTLRLDTPGLRAVETRAHVTSPNWMFLSADGSRLGSIERGILSVAELPSGNLLAAVRIGQPTTFAAGVFADKNLVRVYTRLFADEGPLEVLELDVPSKVLLRTGKAPSPRAWYWGFPLHDRYVDMDHDRRLFTLHDGKTGVVLATLRDGGPLSSAWVTALADGRWALLLADESGSWIEVFSPAGAPISRIEVGPKGFLRPGGEVAPGKLVVASASNLYVADLDHGTSTPTAHLRPINFWRSGLVRPGSEATKLYLDGSRTLVRFDPATGDRKILLGSVSK
jgi:hypothetical protein